MSSFADCAGRWRWTCRSTAQDLQGNAPVLQTLADSDEVENASGKPIELGDDESVAFAGIIKRRFQLIPLTYR
jgi:hypothetical protein